MDCPGTLIHEQGPLLGSALGVVDLDREDADEAPVGLPRVLVGVSRRASFAPSAFDILLCEEADPPAPFVGCPDGVEAALAAVEAGVLHAPLAAVTLAQVLRVGERMDLERALVLESLGYGVLQAGPEHARWLATRRPHGPRDQGHPPVRVERHGATLEVTLDRPEVRNAVDAHVRDGLCEALAVALLDPSVELVRLRGAGPSFCAGGDLAEFGTTPDVVTAHAVRTTRSVAAHLIGCRDRLEAYVHGACVGAGIEMAAFAHRIVAGRDARFMLPEVGFGLIPGAGGTVSIPRRIGRHRAAYLAITGLPIDAPLAARWGLVDEVSDLA